MFAEARPDQRCFGASTNYTRYPQVPDVPRRMHEHLPHVKTDTMCLDSRYYALQIERYLEYYPREALLLLRFRDLRNDPVATMRRVLDFVGVDATIDIASDPIVENSASRHTASGVRTMMMAPLRHAPVLRYVKRYVPASLKRRVFAMLQHTQRGKSIMESISPKPMRPETRVEFIERFRRPNERLAKKLISISLAGTTDAAHSRSAVLR